MASLKQLIHEIHRRSLWQVLVIYLGASLAVMEATNQVVEQYLLPEWVYPAALILLLIGFPIVLATAFVREDREAGRVREIRDPTLRGGVRRRRRRLGRPWRRRWVHRSLGCCRGGERSWAACWRSRGSVW